MALARGDIVLVPFPFTDLTARKVRPSVIISPDPQALDVVVAFLSSVIPPELTDTDWVLPTTHSEFALTGLKTTSVFRLGKLLTLHRALILRKLGRVGPSIQRDLDVRLRQAVGLTS
jgi:mRNA interferase MazF